MPGLKYTQVSLNEFEWVLKGGAAEIAHNCFVFSLCQHREPEDREGKLSMWRAYGSGDIRVAVIAKTIPALQFAQGVLPTPVLYGDRDMVRRELEAKAQLVDDQISALRSLPPDLAAAQAARLLINMAVAIKHPGFCEEQEWRFVYLPITPSQQMEAQRQGVVFGGVPQVVYKMPITLPKDEGYDPTANFFQKIILGPCAESETVRAGLVALLAGYGFNNPDPLVTKCGIPYRPRM